MRATHWAVVAAAGMAASAAVAGPPGTPPGKGTARVGPAVPVSPEGPGWSDGFESYASGAGLNGQGGWAVWCSGGVDGMVSTAQAHSGSKSFRATNGTDMVQQFTGANSGQWVFKIWTYVPTGPVGDGFIIVLNNYCATANPDWSIVVRLSALSGLVGSWSGGAYTQALPLIRDQWVEYRAEIDLATDSFKEYYGGQLLATNASWSANVGAGGMVNIAALDVFSETLDGIFYDDASLEPEGGGCYPDCNGDNVLNLADFGCFQTKFALGDPYADCNGDNVLNLADFGCFQTKFALGCP